MAGKYGPVSASVTLDDHGGTPRVITGHIRKIGGLKISQITEENSPFGAGAASERHTPVGKQQFGPVDVEGDFDTTPDTGPHAVFGTLETTPQDSSRTLVVVPGDGKTLTVEVFATEYEPVMDNGKLTGYKAKLVQAGLAAWTG